MELLPTEAALWQAFTLEGEKAVGVGIVDILRGFGPAHPWMKPYLITIFGTCIAGSILLGWPLAELRLRAPVSPWIEYGTLASGMVVLGCLFETMRRFKARLSAVANGGSPQGVA